MTTNSYQLRLLRVESDVQSLLRLLAEIEQFDQFGEDVSESTLRAQFEWFGHDPQLDRWIIHTDGDPHRFLAHAWTFAQTSERSVVYVAVHPLQRRQGLGSELMRIAINRAREIGATQVVSIKMGDDDAGETFLKKHNFESAGHNRFFSALANVSLPEPQWLDGFQAKPLTEFGDISLYVEALNACYSDMWGHAQNTVATTAESFSKNLQEYSDFYDKNGMFVVFDVDDNVSGICSARVESKTSLKRIDSPAIVPEYRDLLLLRPLVLTVMRWLDGQSDGEFRLDTWGDSKAAATVYTNLGFELLPNGFETEYLLEFSDNK